MLPQAKAYHFRLLPTQAKREREEKKKCALLHNFLSIDFLPKQFDNKELRWQQRQQQKKKPKTKHTHTHTQNKPKQSVRHKEKKDSGKQTPGKKCCASMVYRNGDTEGNNENRRNLGETTVAAEEAGREERRGKQKKKNNQKAKAKTKNTRNKIKMQQKLRNKFFQKLVVMERDSFSEWKRKKCSQRRRSCTLFLHDKETFFFFFGQKNKQTDTHKNKHNRSSSAAEECFKFKVQSPNQCCPNIAYIILYYIIFT